MQLLALYFPGSGSMIYTFRTISWTFGRLVKPIYRITWLLRGGIDACKPDVKVHNQFQSPALWKYLKPKRLPCLALRRVTNCPTRFLGTNRGLVA
jgi:hypothetical protein